MPIAGIRAARSFLDELQRDLLETEDQDFDEVFDRWSALGVPEIDEYRGERRRSRGELISEINRTRRAIDKRPEILREEEAGETPIMTGARRVARGAEVLQGMMENAEPAGPDTAPLSVPDAATEFSPEPVDFEAETGNTPRLDDGFAADQPSAPAPPPKAPGDEAGPERPGAGVWKPRGMVDGRLVFRAKGPIRVTGTTTALGVEGIRFTVDWIPLSADGRRMPIVRNERLPQHGGPLVTGIPKQWLINPPFARPEGFEVTVNVPPQAATHGNTAGVFLSVEALE